MATHSSILAGEILWSEESSRLQSMGSQRDTTHTHTQTIKTITTNRGTKGNTSDTEYRAPYKREKSKESFTGLAE